MNPKQAIQAAPALVSLATVAPPLVLGGLIGLGVVLLIKALSESTEERQPEVPPVTPEAKNSQNPAETAVFRQIPAKPTPAIPAPPAPTRSHIPTSLVDVRPAPAQISTPPAVRVAVQPTVVQPTPAAPVTPQPVAPVTPPATPQFVAKKIITRADMATIFDNGKRTLTRTATVAELKRRGFGKSAAYSATAPDGRFSAWLIFASDGIISWTDGQEDN